MELEFPRQITETYSTVNFDAIASTERRGGTNGRTYRQTDRQTNGYDEAISQFRNFCERALKVHATSLIGSKSKLKGQCSRMAMNLQAP